MIPPVVVAEIEYEDVGRGFPLGPLSRMVNPGDPVKVIMGLPLLVKVSSAPVSVSFEMSIGPVDADWPGFVFISNEPTSVMLPAVLVA